MYYVHVQYVCSVHVLGIIRDIYLSYRYKNPYAVLTNKTKSQMIISEQLYSTCRVVELV